MNLKMLNHILSVCDKKIATKGENVGLSFYAFFKNSNDNPKQLFQVAEWWIKTNKLDHFEKAAKIKNLILQLKNSKKSL